MARFASSAGTSPLIAAIEPDTPLPLLRRHIIVAGLGPAGRGVIDAMHTTGQFCAAIDLNPRSVAEARRQALAEAKAREARLAGAPTAPSIANAAPSEIAAAEAEAEAAPAPEAAAPAADAEAAPVEAAEVAAENTTEEG